VPPLGESRAVAWRMANVDLRNLRYYSAAGYGKPQSEFIIIIVIIIYFQNT